MVTLFDPPKQAKRTLTIVIEITFFIVVSA